MSDVRSQPCHLAGHTGIAMTLEGVAALHNGCPGLCVENGGKVVRCGCGCHEDQAYDKDAILASEVALPRAVAILADGRERPAQNKSAPRGTGACEHCGAQTGGRFAPGHDAKLKSILQTGAQEGNHKDWAELVLRGWVTGYMQEKVDVTIQAKGEQLAEDVGMKLVELRSQKRIEAGTPRPDLL